MRNINPTHKIIHNNVKYKLVIPMGFEILIPKDDSVRLLSQITDGLDYRNLAMAQNI